MQPSVPEFSVLTSWDLPAALATLDHSSSPTSHKATLSWPSFYFSGHFLILLWSLLVVLTGVPSLAFPYHDFSSESHNTENNLKDCFLSFSEVSNCSRCSGGKLITCKLTYYLRNCLKFCTELPLRRVTRISPQTLRDQIEFHGLKFHLCMC